MCGGTVVSHTRHQLVSDWGIGILLVSIDDSLSILIVVIAWADLFDSVKSVFCLLLLWYESIFGAASSIHLFHGRIFEFLIIVSSLLYDQWHSNCYTDNFFDCT